MLELHLPTIVCIDPACTSITGIPTNEAVDASFASKQDQVICDSDARKNDIREETDRLRPIIHLQSLPEAFRIDDDLVTVHG